MTILCVGMINCASAWPGLTYDKFMSIIGITFHNDGRRDDGNKNVQQCC